MGALLISLLSTGVLVFSGVFFLFKKHSSKRPFRNPSYWITSLLISPIIYAGIIFIWLLWSSSFTRKEFNKKEWENNRDSRYELVDDLVNNQKLIGLTMNEVKSILGEPDGEFDSTITYYIGYSPQYFLNSDPDWLELETKNQKVSNANIRE